MDIVLLRLNLFFVAVPSLPPSTKWYASLRSILLSYRTTRLARPTTSPCRPCPSSNALPSSTHVERPWRTGRKGREGGQKEECLTTAGRLKHCSALTPTCHPLYTPGTRPARGQKSTSASRSSGAACTRPACALVRGILLPPSLPPPSFPPLLKRASAHSDYFHHFPPHFSLQVTPSRSCALTLRPSSRPTSPSRASAPS